jgi:hypothetical protein
MPIQLCYSIQVIVEKNEVLRGDFLGDCNFRGIAGSVVVPE